MSDNLAVVHIINKRSSKGKKKPYEVSAPLNGTYIFEQNTYLENII